MTPEQDRAFQKERREALNWWRGLPVATQKQLASEHKPLQNFLYVDSSSRMIHDIYLAVKK
jgi:hypothetical protein